MTSEVRRQISNHCIVCRGEFGCFFLFYFSFQSDVDGILVVFFSLGLRAVQGVAGDPADDRRLGRDSKTCEFLQLVSFSPLDDWSVNPSSWPVDWLVRICCQTMEGC